MATSYGVGKASFTGMGNKNFFSNNLMTSNYSVSDKLYNDLKDAYGSDIGYGDINNNDFMTLQKLYLEREANNGLINPNEEAQIEADILKLEKELGVAHKPDGWESFCDTAVDVGATAVTFVASVGEGIVDVGETIVDGTVQVVGGVAAYTVGVFNEDAGQAMKEGIQSFVSYDASGAMYDAFVDVTGIDEDIAYGWAHTAGNITGQVAGYAAITMFTGGAGTVLLSGAAAAGSTAETAYASGASFDEAMFASTANAALGMAGGAAMNKVGTFAKGVTSLNGVAGYTAAGAGIGAAEPLLNTAVEYATYGNNNGQSYMEYMDESGGWTKVAMGAGAGGLSTGAQAFKSYNGVNNYKNSVKDRISVDTKIVEKKWKHVQESYDAVNGKGTFSKLTESEQKIEFDKISFTDQQISKIRKAAVDEIDEHVNNTINNTVNDYRNGKYNTKYTVGDILRNYDGDQVKYWTDESLMDYYNEFLELADSNGNVKVYAFQNNSPASKNYKTFGGNIGREDGCFVMSEVAYQKLLKDSTIFDSSGKVINSDRLGEVLGGVDFGGSSNIISIEQSVNISEIKLPNGGYSGAFPEYWSPGGKTVDTAIGRGLVTEAVIRQGNINNSGAKIIQH